MKTKILQTVALGTIGAFLFAGCGATKTQYVNSSTRQAPVTLGIDSADFENAASTMITSMLQGGTLNKPDGSRYVIMMSDIVNDTTQRIDTRMLTQKIRKALLNSGKAIFTNAMGTQRDDATIIATREQRGNEEFDQSTVVQSGTLISAELGLFGRIMQRTASTDDNKQYVEYYFQLQLTNAKNGLVYWEDESVVGKIGSNKSVVW